MWILYALLAAGFWAVSDAFCKGILAAGRSREGFLAWARILFALPLVGLVPLVWGVAPLDQAFWGLTLLWLPLEIVALLAYLRAIRLSPLSLVAPFLALTPLFLLVTSWAMLGERPDATGALGVAAIVGGAYLLKVREVREGWWEPLRALAREPGVRWMVLAAFIYSINANLGKLAVLRSSPSFFSFYYTAVLAVALVPIGRGWELPAQFGRRPTVWLAFLLAGLSYGTMTLFHMLAIEQAPVAYMIALKRTSILFSVLLGGVFFRERGLEERLLGSALMLVGIALIRT